MDRTSPSVSDVSTSTNTTSTTTTSQQYESSDSYSDEPLEVLFKTHKVLHEPHESASGHLLPPPHPGNIVPTESDQPLLPGGHQQQQQQQQFGAPASFSSIVAASRQQQPQVQQQQQQQPQPSATRKYSYERASLRDRQKIAFATASLASRSHADSTSGAGGGEPRYAITTTTEDSQPTPVELSTTFVFPTQPGVRTLTPSHQQQRQLRQSKQHRHAGDIESDNYNDDQELQLAEQAERAKQEEHAAFNAFTSIFAPIRPPANYVAGTPDSAATRRASAPEAGDSNGPSGSNPTTTGETGKTRVSEPLIDKRARKERAAEGGMRAAMALDSAAGGGGEEEGIKAVCSQRGRNCLTMCIVLLLVVGAVLVFLSQINRVCPDKLDGNQCTTIPCSMSGKHYNCDCGTVCADKEVSSSTLGMGIAILAVGVLMLGVQCCAFQHMHGHEPHRLSQHTRV